MVKRSKEEPRREEGTEGEEGSMVFLLSQFKMFSVNSVVRV